VGKPLRYANRAINIPLSNMGIHCFPQEAFQCQRHNSMRPNGVHLCYIGSTRALTAARRWGQTEAAALFTICQGAGKITGCEYPGRNSRATLALCSGDGRSEQDRDTLYCVLASRGFLPTRASITGDLSVGPVVGCQILDSGEVEREAHCCPGPFCRGAPVSTSDKLSSFC
jgi:hypothetical protein